MLPDRADPTRSQPTEHGSSRLFPHRQAPPHGWSNTLRVVPMDAVVGRRWRLARVLQRGSLSPGGPDRRRRRQGQHLTFDGRAPRTTSSGWRSPGGCSRDTCRRRQLAPASRRCTRSSGANPIDVAADTGSIPRPRRTVISPARIRHPNSWQANRPREPALAAVCQVRALSLGLSFSRSGS
jgi:hypothetical protein